MLDRELFLALIAIRDLKKKKQEVENNFSV